MVLGAGAPAHAVSTALTPPTATDAIAPTQLPACSSIDASTDADARPSVLLGWAPKTARFLVNKGTYAQEFAPSIPCFESGAPSPTRVLMTSSRVSGTKTGTQVIATGVITWRCFDPSTGDQTTVVGGVAGSTGVIYQAPSSNVVNYAQTTSTISLALCPRIVSVTITAKSGYPDFDGQSSTAWVWKPGQWSSSDGGWTPGTNVNDFYPDGVELPIICTVNNSGADVFEVIKNFFGSLVQLPACLFIPVGWDRAGRIAAEWQGGAAGELSDAWRDAMPNGLVCGPVVSFPFYGVNVNLDTCAGDFAPGWVKNVVGWIIVLGLCGLMVARLFWVVGSKA